MKSLAEQIEVFAGGTPDTRHSPDPKTRTCSYCNQRHEINDDWTCSGCGEKSTFFSEFVTCPTCNERKLDVYAGNRLLKKGECFCDMAPARKAEILLRRRRREAEKTAWVETRRQAEACWIDKNRACSEPRNKLPHPFCSECVRFKPRGQQK